MSTSLDSELVPCRLPLNLRVVPLDTIWVHEHSDPSRCVALQDALRQQGVLENPVVVSPIAAAIPGHHRFVHLDGANRIAALRALGCARVVVQVVALHQPQQVRLSTWAHRTWIDPVDFFGHLQRLREVDLQPLCRQGGTTADHATAAFIFCQESAYDLCLRRPTVVNRIAALQAVIALYGRRIERYKLPRIPEPQVVARHLAPDRLDGPQPVLITFAPLQVEDLLALASDGIPAPPGVTRFILSGGRAMGLNVPLSLLRAGTCATSAATWLATLRGVQPVIVPGPCRVREYLGWRDYEADEPLLVYHPTRWMYALPGGSQYQDDDCAL